MPCRGTVRLSAGQVELVDGLLEVRDHPGQFAHPLLGDIDDVFQTVRLRSLRIGFLKELVGQ